MTTPHIEIHRLSKSYGGVHALRDVDLQILPGQVHAVCGENGAGKSTLIKALCGVVRPDQGEIRVDGRPIPLGDVHASQAAGIAVIHQESTAFPDLDAVDNIFVGRELRRWGGLFLDHRAMRAEAARLLEKLGERIDLTAPLGRLPIAQRQMVLMARALSQNCRLLIMDEPTASLSARETELLLQIVRQLRSEGVSVLYVSHRLEEVFRIADRITVLRDGRHVSTDPAFDLDAEQLIRRMVGREVDELTRRHLHGGRTGDPVLCVENLCLDGVLSNVSLSLCEGEIVGLAGLIGAGRSELARAIFGIDRYDAGSVTVDGRRLPSGSTRAAMDLGLALVPEDRQHEGLVLPMSVGKNLSLAMLSSQTTLGMIRRRREAELVASQMQGLGVRAAGADVPAQTLSGGNQQKLVIGKWLATQPKVLILDEPTRGIDVGAKAQVHRLVRELAADGLAVLLISSEMPELLSLCDRILVMKQGRLAGEVDGAAATQEQLLALALPDGEKVQTPVDTR